MMIEVQKVKTHRNELHSRPVSSTLQAVYDLSSGGHPVRFAMDPTGFAHKPSTEIQFQ